MSEERRKILEMLSEGKISVEEAEKLLAAVSKTDSENIPGATRTGTGSSPRYLRVLVEPGSESKNGERVNIRVPIKLIRAGLKFASFIPKHAQTKVNKVLDERGIDVDFANMKPEDLDEIILQLNDLSVDVDDGREKVHIFCE